MIIIGLFGIKYDTYPNEHIPELLDAIHDFGNEDDPEYLNKSEKYYRDLEEFRIIKRIEIELDDNEFNKIFIEKPLKGKINI